MTGFNGYGTMKKPAKELKIGLLVVLTVALAYFAINYLRGKDVFDHDREYTVRYADVSGLKTSAAVYIKGFRAGTVDLVEYSPETGDFYAVCSIDKRFMIPKDSRFEIYSSDIMGGKALRVIQGVSSEEAGPDDILEGIVAADMMGALMEKLPSVLDNLDSALDSLSAAVGSVRGVVDGNSEDIRSLVASLASVAARLDGIAAGAGEVVPDLKVFAEKMRGISESLADGKEDIGSIISDLSAVSSQLKDAGLGDMAASLSEILSAINSAEGNAGLLLKDGSLYRRVDSLVADVDSLVRAIKDNPKKYIRISVF